jgi:hypothetical protein
MRRGISKYVSFKQTVPSMNNITRYQLNITWTQDQTVQEQLRVIQCVANFQGRTNPCRTSMVTIDFEESSRPGMFSNLRLESDFRLTIKVMGQFHNSCMCLPHILTPAWIKKSPPPPPPHRQSLNSSLSPHN